MRSCVNTCIDCVVHVCVCIKHAVMCKGTGDADGVMKAIPSKISASCTLYVAMYNCECVVLMYEIVNL